MTSPLAATAHALFHNQQHAVLCTAHASLAGWPFGSITPYSVLPSRDAVVFLSAIAEHTKNLARDPRASLFITDPAAQARPQAGARVTILTRARCASAAEQVTTEASYFARFPQAEAMRSAHGFHTWVLEVDCVRFIAGFGEMGWISRAEWSGTPDPLATHAAAIAAHLNADHAAAMVELVRHVCGVEATSAVVSAVDRGGLMVTAQLGAGASERVRVPFTTVAETQDDVRRVVVAMLKDARLRRTTP